MATTKEEGEEEYARLRMAGASLNDDNPEERDDAENSVEEQSESLDDSISAEQARTLKEEGNALYKNGQYSEAVDRYSIAAKSAHASDNERAVYLANRAAAHLKLGDYKAVVDDTTAALKLKPGYKKALLRRCEARESQQDFAGAAEDAKASGEPPARIKRLETFAAEKAEKQKQEAMEQLKGLGNSLLSNFGLSLDNFQMEQDPNTGSYNIKMRQ